MVIVKEPREFNVGKGRNEVWSIMVVLKFIKSDLYSGGNIEWKDNFINFKLEHPVPPNQSILPKSARNKKKKIVSDEATTKTSTSNFSLSSTF